MAVMACAVPHSMRATGICVAEFRACLDMGDAAGDVQRRALVISSIADQPDLAILRDIFGLCVWACFDASDCGCRRGRARC